MLISKNWLKDYVFLPDSLDPKELALKLTLTTVEVEGITMQGEFLDHIVVGVVKKAEKHPSADRLQVCQVNIGNEDVQIVCGGSNVVQGMKVALGKIGAKVLWHGEGDPVILAETTIRGVASFGMICAAEEIGLGDMFPKKDEKEILDLSHLKAAPGTPLKQALQLDDVIFEIDNKSLSNRPDLWGHLGMAREIAAIGRKELTEPAFPALKGGKDIVLTVDNTQPDMCARYMGVVISGISVGPSPEHIQRRLASVGIRPVNNIVDITNYVMLDLGQPLHAFDLRRAMKGESPAITVRSAEADESLIALDGKTYSLAPSMLVIANEDKPMAIAGVMGGEETAVHEGTTVIILESANFDAGSIRKTSQALNLRTESSTRFEKMLDRTLCASALASAVRLIKEACPDAVIASNIVDIGSPQEIRRITIRTEEFSKKIGAAIEKKTIIDILSRLGFIIKEKKDELSVTVPSWRATKDVASKEDLVEEVARVFGYEKIPSILPKFSIEPPEAHPIFSCERIVRDFLSSAKQFSEVYNYSFISPESAGRAGIMRDQHIELDNPIAKDRPLLRRTLMPGLLENVEENFHAYDRVALFELGRVYLGEEPGGRAAPNDDELLPRQPHMLGLVYTEKGVDTPFFTASDAIDALFAKLGISYRLAAYEPAEAHMHPGRAARILASNEEVGRIFELHPAVQQQFGLEERIAYAEVDISRVVAHRADRSAYESVPLYPSVHRDIAFVVDSEVAHEHMLHALATHDPLITHVELFDVYHGKHIEAGKKSMAYRITYQSKERTLQTEEVERIHTELIHALQKEFGATVRA